jgi:tripartite-type tricarboxylate transporter receptor subunit TctC
MKSSTQEQTALRIIVLLGTLLCVASGSSTAQQQAYPARPIEIIVPFAPGGSIDITMRTIAPSLGKRLGQSIVIINKPGGGATIGMNQVAKAPPDGYTLGAASFAFAANPVVLETIPYDALKDFAPITMVARSPMLMVVNPASPATTVQEFIDWAKSKPGELNYGSVGVGSSGHLITELFMARAGIKMIHVPFTTGPLGPLAQGLIHLQFGPIPSTIPWVKDGRLRCIGVTSLDPDPTVPDIPPVSRTLPGFDTFEWPGLVAPAGTPRQIVDRIQKDVALTVAEPEVKERLAVLGSTSVADTPDEFRAFIEREVQTWARLGISTAKLGETK